MSKEEPDTRREHQESATTRRPLAKPQAEAAHTPPSERARASLPEDVRPRDIDTINDETMDSTVDADGKNRDATREPFGSDNVVGSNATLENAIDTPSEGLAGIDSRPGGNMPRIATEDGASVVGGKSVDIPAPYDAPDEPQAGNSRVARTVKIVRKDSGGR